jgi:N-acetylglutamate synthase-like GNAT family acetyltransferase
MVVYRKALAEDVDGVAPVLLKNYNIKSKEEAKEVFLEELSIYNYIVAEDDGKIVGIACWRMHGLPKHSLAECARVAIMPKYKGKGVATELFGRIVRDADRFYKTHNSKLRKIYAYMHSSNKKAQEFFSSLGLIQEAILKDHYYKGEDEYIYSMFMD